MINDGVLIAALFAFVVSVISGFIFIPLLRRFKLGQNIRDDGPKRHIRKKSGTPTIGGVIILIGLILAGSYAAIKFNVKYEILFSALLFTLGCGIIGFLDDYIKVKFKRSLGLTAMQKMLALIIISVVFVLYVYNFTNVGSTIIVPFLSDYEFNLGALYIPFVVFVILGTVNSVNLTDGLDGLATGITIIISIFFILASLILDNISIAVFSSVLAGSCLGFLVFNIYPAKVFMGDTGSLAIGGAVSAISITLKLPLFLVIVGAVFMIESLSVMIQVLSFKSTGKRVFKMTPIHHHFELVGWRETKVVIVFWTATGLLNILGLLALL